MTSGPVMVTVLEGAKTLFLKTVKSWVILTPAEALASSTLRADYADSIDENAVHGF
ncbi:nucleoside-diphosphate kinase (plasmid) [Pseudoalteromonas espejiana]